jgi:hypothetical protein
MDATGAGTSTGQGAGPADVTESAGEVTAGPARPAGRADATGPLPVPAPTDPTGPLPAPQAGPPLANGADVTAAQPAVPPAAPPASPPSWFETGPLPVIPTAPDNAAPDNAAPPEVATPPAGAGVPADLLAASHTPSDPSTPPAGAFEPAISPPPPNGVPTDPHPPVPVPPPPTGVKPAAGPPPPAGSGHIHPLPPTATLPAVGPPAPMTASPPAALFTPATPPASSAAPTTPQPPIAAGPPAPPAAGIPAGPAPAPPAGLFTPVAPRPGPAAPIAQEPPTGLFAAVTPPPVAPPAPPVPAPPTAGFPAAPADVPARPADATGPMPMINAAVAPPAAAPLDVSPPAPPAGMSPQPPVPAAPPRTDAWAFSPEPTPPPRTDPRSPTSDDRRRGTAQSWPLPTPAGGGHSTSVTPLPASQTASQTGSQTGSTPKKRRAWPLTVVGVLVAVAAGIALVFSVARTNPADLATTAAAEAGKWPGAHYRGAIAAIDGGEIRFDLIVTADGASGTLSRDDGRATAELLWDQGGALIRANREWWLYHHPRRADDLAGSWVAEPLTETQEIDAVLRLDAAALARQVRGDPARWQALEQQLVEGRPGIVLSDGSRRVVVGSEDAHPLLAVDVAPEGNMSPVAVSRPTEEEIAATMGAAARMRQEAAPKTLEQLLQERPNVGIQLQPDPLCTAQTCNLTVTLTNSGSAPARGRLEIKANGQVVANHPLDVQPGQVATFTATAPNPQFGQPDAGRPILWESRAVDD